MLLAMTHVMLHLGLCAPIAQLPPESNVAVHVRLTDRSGRSTLDRTFRVERGDGPQTLVEFDSNFGTYRMDVATEKHDCRATDFLYFLNDDGARSITEQLDTAPPTVQVPLLLSGNAPQSLLYANPTFVVFDKSAAVCGKPVPAALTTAHSTVENDGDSYFAALYNDDPNHAPESELIALKLQTPTHQHHYVRLNIPYPTPPLPWPGGVLLDVTTDMMDGLATDPVDTLLCPRMWKTTVG
ncbi:MAG: hypothetical protein JO277_15180 [Candidatus Eremiobacteraeota bacterium]|nr:hypothetical protein [Candidatus Eremiobacteraeota bacterium]